MYYVSLKFYYNFIWMDLIYQQIIWFLLNFQSNQCMKRKCLFCAKHSVTGSLTIEPRPQEIYNLVEVLRVGM